MKKHIMVTCYDATFAHLVARSAVVDSVLVGDSLGMVIQGASTTLGVTMEHMIYHTKAVRAGLTKAQSIQLKSPILIADMPVSSYDTPESAEKHALQLIETGADMVKVEGPVASVVERLVSRKIRVCGHIGLTPQSIQDYKVQGREPESAIRLKNEALLLESAGIEMLVLEMLPAGLASEITKSVHIPTIGIGAGPECSGQVLVLYDLLGLNLDFKPRFLKRFCEAGQETMKALEAYADEVEKGSYPSPEQSFR